MSHPSSPPTRRLSRAILERVWGRSRIYRVFTHDAARGWGARDEQTREFAASSPPPHPVVAAYRRHAGRVAAQLMLSRLARGHATLLSIMEGDDMLAYGWLQEWPAMRREFWWLGDTGLALGPYWTHPDHRGKGLYGRMLGHSLAICRDRPPTPLFIWARAENAPSIAGIERTGFFRDLGRHQVRVAWFGLVRRHAALDG